MFEGLPGLMNRGRARGRQRNSRLASHGDRLGGRKRRDPIEAKYRERRLETDPGSLGGPCFGESDGEIYECMGEDFGEEIFDFAAFEHINQAKKRKVIRSLHKFRERLQVLNEDLDVCIFNGEEDFDDEEES